MNKKMRNLVVRTISGAVYVALMVLSVYFEWIAILLSIFFAVVGIHEFLSLAEAKNEGIKKRMPYLSVAAMLLMSVFQLSALDNIRFPYFYLISIFMLAVFLPELIDRHENSLERVALSAFSQLWIVLPLSVLFLLWIPMNPVQVLAFFIIIWASDTFAYLGGSLFGKHKLAEEISPGKTWEGFAISCVFTVALAVGMSFIPYFDEAGLSRWNWVEFACIVEVFGLCGDLMESLFKRRAGVKDSGNIIPGHGGILDRLDSILFAAIPLYFFCL